MTRPKLPNGQVSTLFRGVDTALRSKGTRAVRHAARTLLHAGVGGGLKGGTRGIGVSKAKLYEMLSICPVASENPIGTVCRSIAAAPSADRVKGSS